MSHDDVPGVAFHPPFLLAALLVAGWTLRQVAPLPVLPPSAVHPVGGLLTALSFALFTWAVVTMLRAGTNIPPHLPVKALVRHGPFACSRNPIYLSFAIGFAALAALLNTAWFVVMDVLFVSLITAGVIVREERYLRRKFGTAYAEYAASVRRWL